MNDPLYIAAAGVLLAVVVAIVVWMRHRATRRVEQLESRAERKLREVARERDEQLDRLEREWEGELERAPLELASDLLSAFDALESALQQARAREDTDLKQGLEMIRREFVAAFADHGIQLVEPEPGTTFDPDIHEAMDVVEADEDLPDGTIATCRRPGFRHSARVVRPALVTVAREQNT